MRSSLNSRVLTSLKRQEMFRAGERVEVGVSGGGDSVALLSDVRDLAAKAKQETQAGHRG
jgi:tRNA(Ile)-lysidine synthase TilS/MesJ